MTISETIRLVRVRTVSTPYDRSADVSADDGQSDVVARCTQWHKAFREATVAYPASVLTIPRAAKWIRERGCKVDARSPQEIAFAMSAGVTPARVMFHCANATGRTIHDAIRLGIGQFIVDSESAAAMLGACAEGPQRVLVDVTSGRADGVITAVRREEQLSMIGFHSELGNTEDAVLRMMEHMSDVRRRGLRLSFMGVAVRGGLSMSPEALAESIGDAIDDGCARFRLPRPVPTVCPDWMALTHDM